MQRCKFRFETKNYGVTQEIRVYHDSNGLLTMEARVKPTEQNADRSWFHVDIGQMLANTHLELVPGVYRGWHCVKVSPGCANCYAERMNLRLGTGERYSRGAVQEPFLDLGVLRQPIHWRKPRMVFVCSMTDLFGDWVKDEWLHDIFGVMALSPQHTFQVLTKRPERMLYYLKELCRNGRIVQDHARFIARGEGYEVMNRAGCFAWPLSNVWCGVSCEDQLRFNARVKDLEDTPAAVRWVSCEPLLGPVHFTRPKIDWVVAGGESGPGARPMHPLWARSLRDQCQAANIPFFFKQWGEWLPKGQDGAELAQRTGFYKPVFFRSGSAALEAFKVGKKLAGRYLDGRTWDEMPRLRACGAAVRQAEGAKA